MDFIINGSGIFIYPLGLCSIAALMIIIERLISLRGGKVIPRRIEKALYGGELPEVKGNSSAGRIVAFYKFSNCDAEALKAFALLEINKLDRGMFVLDIVISAAPLLGLLGTVAGLVSVFASNDGTPNPESISKGVALALSTTMLGLSIAIPAIIGSSFLNRKIDKLSARLNVCVERLLNIKDNAKCR